MVIGFVGCIFMALVVGRRSGRGTFGMVTDHRGKYSLSRLQLLLWTSLLVGGYFGIAMARVVNRIECAFINIPWNVLILMGISTASALGGEAIKSVKIQRARVSPEKEEYYDRRVLERFVDGVAGRFGSGGLLEAWKYVRKELPKAKQAIENEAAERPKVTGEFLRTITELSEMSESEINSESTRAIGEYLRALSVSEKERRQIQGLPTPSLMDLFFQEEKEVESFLDIGKFQMFCWTCVALLIYSAHLISLASADLEGIEALPDVSTGFLGLMGISQGAYLAMKVPDKQQPR
jgi:hypothetical protein